MMMVWCWGYVRVIHESKIIQCGGGGVSPDATYPSLCLDRDGYLFGAGGLWDFMLTLASATEPRHGFCSAAEHRG